MTFWQEVALVFEDIGWVTAVCLALGIVFVIVEMCQPGVGFFGIVGAILIVFAIVFRAFHGQGNGNPIIQISVLLAITIVVLAIAWGMVIYSMRKGWLSRTGLVEKGTAVSRERSEGTEDFSYLIGKDGVAITTLRPSGTVLIDGKSYDVVSFDGYYDKNTKVTVFDVKGNKITVKRIKTTDLTVEND